MDKNFWQERWEQQQIGFHQNEINPYLIRYWNIVAAANQGRVLVPLCGKSLDMVWLAQQGHEVVGIEIVPMAVEAFFAEQGLQPRRTRQGAYDHWHAGPYTLLCGDFFDIQAADVGPLSAVYDRASLIALPPALRQRYARHVQSLLPDAISILLVTMDYPQEEMNGPPFAVTEAEVRALYGTDFAVKLLESVDVLAENPRFRERGLTRLHEVIYLLQRG